MAEETDMRERLLDVLAEVNSPALASTTRTTVTSTVQSSTYPVYSAPTVIPTAPYDPSDLPIIPTPPAPPPSNTASVIGAHLIALSVFLILALTFIAWRLLVRFTGGSQRNDDDDYGEIAGADGRDAEERAAVWLDGMEGDGRVESWSGFVGKEILPAYRKECGDGEVIVLETIEAVEEGRHAGDGMGARVREHGVNAEAEGSRSKRHSADAAIGEETRGDGDISLEIIPSNCLEEKHEPTGRNGAPATGDDHQDR